MLAPCESPDVNPLLIQEVLFLSGWSTYPFKFDKEGGDEFHCCKGEFAEETSESQTLVLERIIAQIKLFAEQAASVHHVSTVLDDGSIQPGKENHVTRLLTNEFFFYTKIPLNLSEFQQLLMQIVPIAKAQSANIHWVLGSFAVLTPRNAVMNVVVYIQCGSQFELNLIVKNFSSAVDPCYIQEVDGEIKVLPHAVKALHFNDVQNASITLFERQYFFSHHNIILCQTSGGAFFYAVVEICADHLNGLGIENMLALLRAEIDAGRTVIPHCVHSVVSNTVLTQRVYSIGTVTYVDPAAIMIHSTRDEPSTQLMRLPDDQITFGKFATRVVLTPKPIYEMREELKRIASEDGKYLPACLYWACSAGWHDIAQAIIETSFEWQMLCKEVEIKQDEQWNFIQSLFSQLSCEKISLDLLLEQETHFTRACEYWEDGYGISINRMIQMIAAQMNKQTSDSHLPSIFEGIREILSQARTDLLFAWDKWFINKTEIMHGNKECLKLQYQNTGMTLFSKEKELNHPGFKKCKELSILDLSSPIHTIAR